MTNITVEDWDNIGYVLSGKLRLKLLLYLTNKVSTPSHLADLLGEPCSRITVTLRELMDIGVVECLTPDRRKGKLYTATKKGIEIVKEIHEMTDIA